MGLNPNHFRPEVQARKAANRANPDWVRRREFVRASRGFKKKKAVHWMLTWERSGRPDGFPDFDEFWRSHPEALRWLEERKRTLAFDRWLKVKHAAWVAVGMPSGDAGKAFDAGYNASAPPPQ